MVQNELNLFPDSGRMNAATMVSCALAALIALVLGIYWPLYTVNPEIATPVLRPSIVAACFLLMVLWSNLPLSRAEMTMSVLMGVQCVLLLIPTLAATDPLRAFADWAKLVIMCVVAVIVARALRNESTARTFGIVLLLTAIVLAVLLAVLYLKYMGMVVPTYTSSRIYKGIAQKKGISLNAIAFGSLLAFLCGMCLVCVHRWYLYVLGLGIFAVSIVLTGSRTPMAVSVISGFGVVLLTGLRSRKLFVRLTSFCIIVSIGLAAILFVSRAPFSQMSKLSEGRWDLWSVACDKFLEHPVFGSGFESWRDDLVSRLPGEYALTAAIEKNIAGGYHNEYLTLLAEQGLVGFIPTMFLFFYLFRSSWRLAYTDCTAWNHGKWALFTCLIVLSRAALEIPGLFGYSQEPADYLAFFFFAVVVSRVSREEVFGAPEFSGVVA